MLAKSAKMITKDEIIEKVDITAEPPVNLGIEVKTADRFGLSATLSISNSNLNIFEYSWYAAKDGCDEVKIKDWTTADSNISWIPKYGYYWTLFRVYDENGVLIDEQCYGFANIHFSTLLHFFPNKFKIPSLTVEKR